MGLSQADPNWQVTDLPRCLQSEVSLHMQDKHYGYIKITFQLFECRYTVSWFTLFSK